MRRGVLQTPQYRDVCIFCIAKLRRASTATLRSTQQRGFGHGTTNRTPTGTATVLNEDYKIKHNEEYVARRPNGQDGQKGEAQFTLSYVERADKNPRPNAGRPDNDRGFRRDSLVRRPLTEISSSGNIRGDSVARVQRASSYEPAARTVFHRTHVPPDQNVPEEQLGDEDHFASTEPTPAEEAVVGEEGFASKEEPVTTDHHRGQTFPQSSGKTKRGKGRRQGVRQSMSNEEEDEFELDDDEFAERKAARKMKIKQRKVFQRKIAAPAPIFLPEFINVSNLAVVLKIRVEEFIRKVEDMGFGRLSTDHVMDAETAGLIAAEFNFEPIADSGEERDLKARPTADDKSTVPLRPPIVTIMGHVDHGKTTMLDFLRKSSVAASEHGGITQHIGAFSVLMSGGKLVTFLDTPGHEAFLSMRKRGANVTDIVVLVVAADDSVKPQTIEAIKHAQTANVPIIVAVNKIDKEGADIEHVKQDLSRHGVEIEDYGGDTQVVPVSGKTGQGMNELEEAIVALADILDKRAEQNGQVEGWILEAATSKQDGRVATVLVRRGTLRVGDIIVAGSAWARVRSLRNEAGTPVESAGPGTPVEIDGWREQPTAGDEVLQAFDEQKARSVIDYRLGSSKRQQLAKDVDAVNESRRHEQEKRNILKLAQEEAKRNNETLTSVDADRLLPRSSETPAKPVYFIIKADVSGSVEAVKDAISSLGNNEVHAHVLRTGIGSISEFDVEHATASQGHIINFNTPCDNGIQRLAESRGVQILDQSIIYRLVDQVKLVLQGYLSPIVTQRVLGEAEIAEIFDIKVKGRKTLPIAGCKVRNGEISRKAKVRVLRDREVIYTGSFSSLKHIKKDITEARKGMECGMSFSDWIDFKVGDQVQNFEEISQPRQL